MSTKKKPKAIPIYSTTSEIRANKIVLIKQTTEGAILTFSKGYEDVSVTQGFLNKFNPKPKGYLTIDENNVKGYLSEEDIKAYKKGKAK